MAGRKKKYNSTFPKRAEDYAAKGLADYQIAHNLNISVSQFYQYKIDYAEFSEAIKRGKAVIDEIVENKLYERACGFDFEEVHTEYVDKNGKPVIKSQRKVKKHIPADVTAQIFWLKNRMPDKWKDRKDIDHTSDGKPLTQTVIE